MGNELNVRFACGDGQVTNVVTVTAKVPGVVFPNHANRIYVAPASNIQDVYLRTVEVLTTPNGSVPPPPDKPTTWPLLAQLPPDLLLVMSKILSKKDIGRLRLCCNSLATAFIPSLGPAFTTVTISPNAGGVRLLADISKSPFGTYVRHLQVAERGDMEPLFLGLHPANQNQNSSQASTSEFDAESETRSQSSPVDREFEGQIDARSQSSTPEIDDQRRDDGDNDHDANKTNDNEGEPDPGTGPDTLFARQLGQVLCALPALETASIGTGAVSTWWFSHAGRYTSMRPCARLWKSWNSWCGWQPYRFDPRQHIVVAVFRGLLFALAHAHAEESTTAELNIDNATEEDDFPVGRDSLGYDEDVDEYHVEDMGPMGLNDRAFAFTPTELELVPPYLNSLRKFRLTLSYYATLAKEDEESANFNAFIRMCTGLVELDLQGISASLMKGLADAQSIPRLEVFKLQYCRVLPGDLIKVLRQSPHLRQVTLVHVWLKDDTTLRGVSRLWDNVFRSVSQHSAPKPHILQLSHLLEVHGVSGRLPELHRGYWAGRNTYRVDFKCGGCDPPPIHPANTAFLTVQSRAALSHGGFSETAPLKPPFTWCRTNGKCVESYTNIGNVFTQGAALLMAPTFFKPNKEED